MEAFRGPSRTLIIFKFWGVIFGFSINIIQSADKDDGSPHPAMLQAYVQGGRGKLKITVFLRYNLRNFRFRKLKKLSAWNVFWTNPRICASFPTKRFLTSKSLYPNVYYLQKILEKLYKLCLFSYYTYVARRYNSTVGLYVYFEAKALLQIYLDCIKN